MNPHGPSRAMIYPSAPTEGDLTYTSKIIPGPCWAEHCETKVHVAMRRCGLYIDGLVERVEACAAALTAASIAAGGVEIELRFTRDAKQFRLDLTDHRADRAEPTTPPIIDDQADRYGWERLEPEGVRVYCVFLLDAHDGPVIA
jgi:hypothetical protein